MTLNRIVRYSNRLARWEGTTVRILGMIEFVFAMLLVVPTIIALCMGEDYTLFVYPIIPLALLGMFQYFFFYESKNFTSVNGLLLVGLVWLSMFLMSCIPYLISGMTLVDSLFEGISGITTTGLSVMVDVESQPMSLLIWRSMTMWVGGIMVVIAFMYMLPMFGIGRSVFYNELSGSGSSNYSVRMKNAAKSFIFSYGVLSLINIVLLIVLGMDVLEAFCLMCTTISTGGLMFTNDGMASYSDAIQMVTILFMFLGGTNFYLHYRALYKREKKVYRSNSEFRTIVGWFLAISVIIYLLVVFDSTTAHAMSIEEHLETFKNALFTTVSLGTSTGLYVEDFTLYPSQCTALLMMVAIIGASSGSTSGGIKFGRIRIIYEFIKNGFGKILHPNAVYEVKVDGTSVDDDTVFSSLTVFLLFVITMMVGSLIFMIAGMDMVDSFGLAISSVANGGMGFGNFGPTGNFASLEDPLKIVLIILMWLGRLEIVTALVLFTPGFWKELYNERRSKKVSRSRMTQMKKGLALDNPGGYGALMGQTWTDRPRRMNRRRR